MCRSHLVFVGALLGSALPATLCLAQPDAESLAVPVEIAVPAAPAPPHPAPGEPVTVQVKLALNKVSEIDTVAETYHVDAYLSARWHDEAAAELLWRPNGPERTIFLGDGAIELLGRTIWWPDLELINTVGGRDRTATRLEVFEDGKMLYTERFQAELSSNMDFRRYPFDEQSFGILVESYTYREEDLVFDSPEASLGHLRETPSPDWQLGAPHTKVSRHEYGDGWYSRYSLTIDAVRMPGYFVWQVFLPLFLILGASWTVFWLSEMSDKIGVAFTCMLTLVAFNFYTATLLPQLPYNTFIEAVVISSYVATFLLIGYILFGECLLTKGKEAKAARLQRAGRWLFPVGYAVSLALTTLRFF
ncbi:MAG: hypothetical protein MPN21_21595 [Thermoanaerobaculia bacterium]|nr:hypothetical protein [Thermoanaerobaculia bacterium]